MNRFIAILILLFCIHPIFLLCDDDFVINKSNTYRWLLERKKFDSKMVSKLSDFRPKTQASYISPSNIFKIHYDTLGNNVVEAIDRDKNGIPDYIDSVAYYADYVYEQMINIKGLKSPYPEQYGGGSEHYDIYVLDIGNGYRGEAYYGETRAEYEIFPRKIFPKYTSYIIIDNNYSPNDMTISDDGTNRKYPTYTTTGILGMKITLAHEFHHAIQFMYGDPNSNMFSLHEAVSVYMENKLFPESKDYLQYIRSLFKNFPKYAFGDGDATVGYSYGIYFHFLDKYFGDRPIKRMWELVESGLFQFQALDSALKEVNTSILDSWLEFISWIYHTGSRTIDGYSFYQARLFPDITFVHSTELSLNDVFQLKSQVLPLEIRPIRIIVSTNRIFDTPDTLDFFITHTDMEKVFNQFMINSEIDLTYPSMEANSKQICEKQYKASSVSHYRDTAFCRKGYQTIAVSDAYPMPFSFNSHSTLYIPTPSEIPFGEKVFLQIYNPEMEQVCFKETTVMVHNSNRVIALNLERNLFSSGVYFYKVKGRNSLKIGKFVVK